MSRKRSSRRERDVGIEAIQGGGDDAGMICASFSLAGEGEEMLRFAIDFSREREGWRPLVEVSASSDSESSEDSW